MKSLVDRGIFKTDAAYLHGLYEGQHRSRMSSSNPDEQDVAVAVSSF